MRLEILATAGMAVGALACGSEDPVRISYDVTAGVGIVRDLANPDEVAGEILHENMPDLQYSEVAESLVVSRNDMFYAQCDSQKVLGVERTPIDSYGYQIEEGKTTELMIVNEGPDTGVKVLLEEAQEGINEINLFVDGRLIDEDKSDAGSLILLRSDLSGLEFSYGPHIVECQFTTSLGREFSDTASFEVKENRA